MKYSAAVLLVCLLCIGYGHAGSYALPYGSYIANCDRIDSYADYKQYAGDKNPGLIIVTRPISGVSVYIDGHPVGITPYVVPYQVTTGGYEPIPFELRSHPAIGENVAYGYIHQCPTTGFWTPVTIIDADLTPILITPVTTTTKIPLKVNQVTALKKFTGTTTVITTPTNTPVTTVTAVQGTTTQAAQQWTQQYTQQAAVQAGPVQAETHSGSSSSSSSSGSAQTSSAATGSIETANTGALSVTTTPAGVSIFIDGVQRGVSPATIPGLAPGDHTLLLKLDGYTDLSTPVSITAGKTTEYTTGLAKAAKSPGFGAVFGLIALGAIFFIRKMRAG
jgi:hypothetical protein